MISPRRRALASLNRPQPASLCPPSDGRGRLSPSGATPMRQALAALLLLTPALLADSPDPKDPKAPAAREVKLDGVTLPRIPGGVAAPTKMTSLEDLTKLVPDKGHQKIILDQVDLKKEYLLLFVWAGSGGDRLDVKAGKGKDGPEAVFTYTGGRTRDLRQHRKLYALPKGTKWAMAK